VKEIRKLVEEMQEKARGLRDEEVLEIGKVLIERIRDCEVESDRRKTVYLSGMSSYLMPDFIQELRPWTSGWVLGLR
jgi:hypothetical protein